MLKLDYDERLAKDLGISVEKVRETRVSAYVTIREKLRERGISDVPDTDEGLYLWLQRYGLHEARKAK